MSKNFNLDACIEEVIKSFSEFKEREKGEPMYILYGLGNPQASTYVRLGTATTASVVSVLEMIINDLANNIKDEDKADMYKVIFNALTDAFGQDSGKMQ